MPSSLKIFKMVWKECVNVIVLTVFDVCCNGFRITRAFVISFHFISIASLCITINFVDSFS